MTKWFEPLPSVFSFLARAGFTRRLAMVLMAVFFVTGCSTTPLKEDYNPATDARIRIMSRPNQMYINPGKNCYARKDGDMIAAHMGGRALIVPFIPMNRTVGIPKTDKMTTYYHEFIVNAGEPLTIKAVDSATAQMGTTVAVTAGTGHIWRTGKVCADAATFIPEAGQDYDIVLSYDTDEDSPDLCALVLRHLIPKQGDGVEPVVITAERARQCR